MKISEAIKNEKRSISFEIFPPKESADYAKFSKVAVEIASLKPSFVSVTYGAGGGTSNYTLGIAKEIKEKAGIPSIAHLTCINSTKEEVKVRLQALNEAGIENVMALRGDIATDKKNFDRKLLDYQHASDLIKEIKNSGYEFCLGGACYPESHPESKNQEEDLFYLKQKVDLGLDFLTTQMFFENQLFYDFQSKLIAKDINIPVFPGIMPITKPVQIERVLSLSGAFIPKKFVDSVERFADDPKSMELAGIEYAINQIMDLFDKGIQNVHVYTMNSPHVAESIINCVK